MRRAGLGLRFVASLDEAIAQVLERPGAFPALAEPRIAPPVRRAVLTRYPFVVLFVDLGHEIRILAVAHQRREPGYWLYRLADP